MKERQTGLAGENIHICNCINVCHSGQSQSPQCRPRVHDSFSGSSSAVADELHSNMRIKVNNSTIVDCKQMKR